MPSDDINVVKLVSRQYLLFDAKRQKNFLNVLRDCVNITSACRQIQVSPQTILRRRKSDVKFARDFDQCMDEAIDMMEGEARRRAVDGYKEPVFRNGKQIGEITRYSDSLLMFLMKANRPEKYRDSVRPSTYGDLNIEITSYAPKKITAPVKRIRSSLKDQNPISVQAKRLPDPSS